MREQKYIKTKKARLGFNRAHTVRSAKADGLKKFLFELCSVNSEGSEFHIL